MKFITSKLKMAHFWLLCFFLLLHNGHDCQQLQMQVQVPSALWLSANQSSKVAAAESGNLAFASTTTKVPSKRNVLAAAAALGSAASAMDSSNFIASYQNQQNVLQLVRNIDGHLKNIRTLEMRVSTIQVSVFRKASTWHFVTLRRSEHQT